MQSNRKGNILTAIDPCFKFFDQHRLKISSSDKMDLYELGGTQKYVRVYAEP